MDSKPRQTKPSQTGSEFPIPYQKLFEVAQEGIWVIDADSRTTMVNPAMARMLGYTEEEMLGRTLFDYMDERGREIAEANVERRKEGISEQHDFEFITKDGQRLFTTLETAPLADESGNYIGAVAGVIDTTRRRTVEQALQKSEDQFRRVFEESPLGMGILDSTGNFIRVNRRMTEMMGYTRTELECMRFGEVTHPDDRETSLSVTRDLIAGHVTAIDMEKRYITKSGSTFWGRVTVSAVRDENDQFVTSLAMVEDITSRRQAEVERRHLESQLRQSQKMEAIGTLTGGIAHDFNNILQALMGHVEFLKEDLSSQSASFDDVTEIEKGCRRAATLTRQLLEFSRRQVMRPKHLDLNTVVSGVMGMLHRLIGENIDLTFHGAEVPLIVSGDQSQIEQIVVNLTVNARDAMPEGGQITIRTRRMLVPANAGWRSDGAAPGDYAALSVSDTGVGMDKDTQLRIFEPFFTTKSKSEGTGLGLSTVYGIATQHGGSVHVSSSAGSGSSFDIYLPLVTGQSVTETVAERPPALKGDETVLLAEDNDGVRAMIEKVLSAAGYQVVTASNGEEAVRQFKAHRDEIRLAILDVVMPVKSGKAALDEIRAIAPEVQALFVSGYPEAGVHKRHILRDDIDLLQKPFSHRDLLKTVRTVLDRDR